MAKTHFYEHRQAAWDARQEGAVDKQTAENQTVCGYVRDSVTRDQSKVTCKHCLRLLNK